MFRPVNGRHKALHPWSVIDRLTPRLMMQIGIIERPVTMICNDDPLEPDCWLARGLPPSSRHFVLSFGHGLKASEKTAHEHPEGEIFGLGEDALDGAVEIADAEHGKRASGKGAES